MMYIHHASSKAYVYNVVNRQYRHATMRRPAIVRPEPRKCHGASRVVTGRHGSSRVVTGRHGASRGVTGLRRASRVVTGLRRASRVKVQSSVKQVRRRISTSPHSCACVFLPELCWRLAWAWLRVWWLCEPAPAWVLSPHSHEASRRRCWRLA
jgi:hypothetical protein